MTLQQKIADRSADRRCWPRLRRFSHFAAFQRAGFPVIGFDLDSTKIEALHRGENYLKHLGEALVSDMKRRPVRCCASNT